MIRRRWRLLLVLTLLFLVGGLALVPGVRWPVYGWLRGEVFYQGMPTSYWRSRVLQWRKDNGSSSADTAADQLGQSLRWRLGLAVRGRPAPDDALVELLRDEDVAVRLAALLALARTGIDYPADGRPPALADGAVAALITTLENDPDVQARAFAALALGAHPLQAREAVPALLRAARDKNNAARSSAIRALGEIGPAARAVTGDIVSLLDDDDEFVGKTAARALKDIDPEAAAKAGVK